MNKILKSRISTCKELSKNLLSLNDKDLEKLIEETNSTVTSIGGASAILKINDTPIFIKKIRLSDFERKPENWMSTSNIFQLPLYYQYGIGSIGFSAWRELAAHKMTTNWVLNNKCIHFPLMYHYRILPLKKDLMTEDAREKIERDVEYWEGSTSIRSRLLASYEATQDIVLFLEYFPSNLYDWLGEQLRKDVDIQPACFMIENEIKEIIEFMQSHGLLHMDAHFKNIVTEGSHIYFTDFGLALSKEFDLSIDEIKFLNEHQNYDIYSTATNLLHSIITGLYGQDEWIINLKRCVNGETNLPDTLKSIVNRYAPIAIIMDEFYRKLQHQSKGSVLPVNKLDSLI